MLRLRVARLTKAHGLKGGIKLELYTDDPKARFVPGAQFHMQVPETSPWFNTTITLAELRWYNSHPVAFFKEIPDRTAAESAVKAILLLDQDETQLPDEPSAWYDHQLVGLDVYRDGVLVGEIAAVEHMPAQDLLAVRVLDDATGESREVLVPFVAAFVPEVDIAAGRVIVTPPLGLFETIDDEDEPSQSAAAHSATAAGAASIPSDSAVPDSSLPDTSTSSASGTSATESTANPHAG